MLNWTGHTPHPSLSFPGVLSLALGSLKRQPTAPLLRFLFRFVSFRQKEKKTRYKKFIVRFSAAIQTRKKQPSRPVRPVRRYDTIGYILCTCVCVLSVCLPKCFA